ncbi:Ig-like domain-containing protein, partial [uncultured Enterococcus sp.]|uniref:Ig-like domain-containing protein n=1 Tax=uncultured Enterococcus sp. TaxID=167972 RepID=UPI002AA7E3EF
MKKIVKVGMGSIFLFSMLLGQNAFAEDIAHEVKQVPAVEGSGIIDEDKPIIQQTAESGITSYSVLPSKFDFNSGNVKTIMRNQGELGLCWAFSAVDVITASNKKEFGVEYTLSPNYFNYYSARNAFTDAVNPYGTRTLNDGGNSGSVLIQSTLNDNGVLEENFVTPYALSQNKPMMISAFKEKQEKKSPVFVEGMEKIHGISYNYYTKENQQQKIMQMKEKLYEYGALTFSYSTVASHNKKYFNSGTKASFVPIADVGTELVTKYGTDWVKTDHGIVIVGWDDNFSKDNFVETPEKDGAFLVKNSWGESSSSNGVGYFYMSYEDVYMLCSDNYAVDTKMEQYDNVNTYVNTTRTHYVNWSSSNNDMYLGNVYSTKDTRETLNAVSFYSEQKNIGYEVYYSANAIQSGQTIINQKDMKKIASGTVATPGMKEIPTEIVEIDKNQEYSIIIKVNYPKDVDYFHTVLQEVRDAEKGNFPDLKEGKSFVSTDDRSNVIYWRGVSNGDTFGGGFKGNLFVNAFTDNIIDVTEIEMTPTKKELLIGETAQLTAKALPEEAPDKTIVWSSTDSTIVSVDDNGKITSHQAGNAKIIATSKRGDVSAECEVTVEDKHFSVDDIVIGKNMSVLVGEEKQPEFSLVPENADSSRLTWEIKDTSIATVDENGIITGKKLGYTTLVVATNDKKVTKELTVHVNSLYLGKTQAEAKELNLSFNDKGQSENIYTDEAGWLKFKIDTTAMYTVSGVAKGNFKPGQKVEMGFHNSEESRRLGLFGWDQRSTSYGVSWTEAPVYYQKGDYIYIKTGIVSFKDGETQFYFSLKRDTTNPQPIYTKKVTINNKTDITLLKGQTQSFTYTIDNYTTKPNQIELVSDDSNVAEVVEDGAKQFKIIAKNPGKTTIRVKETSGSNKEDSLEVIVPDMFKLGQTKE